MENKAQKKEFKCKRCGYCCIHSYPSFDRNEYKRIKKSRQAIERNVKFKKYIFSTAPDPLSNGKRIGYEFCYFTENGYYNYTIAKDTPMPHKPCEFLSRDENGNSSCAIYSIRPAVCRDFGVKEWECPNNPEYYGKEKVENKLDVLPAKEKRMTFKKFFMGLFSRPFTTVMLVSIIVSWILGSLNVINEKISEVIPVAVTIICAFVIVILIKKGMIKEN